jgi:RHS repeat-associated protein
VSARYLPTASGKEAQDLYTYDGRHRLASITHQLCVVSTGHACSQTTPLGSSTYGYDGNDNRTAVTESSTGGTATTRTYCYDARNQLRAAATTTPCTTTSGDETYTFDPAGNRTAATVSGSTRSFAYGTDGQLDACTGPSCSVTYDAVGRMQTVTDTGATWTFAYDGEGRMTSACAGSTCTGTGFNRVDDLYDGAGHRVQIVETTAAGTVTTRVLSYAGDAPVRETVNGTLTRTYATDEAGRIVEVCDLDCATGTVYLVVWNGHGDATGLWRRNADGSLTLANSYTYATWGTPTTTLAPGFGDLRFRYLYVGASDVQWDDSFGLHLLYMHARTYSPVLGRFLQPDPARADGNLYAYAGNSPATKSDPDGLRPGSWVTFRTKTRPFKLHLVGLSIGAGVAASCNAIMRQTSQLPPWAASLIQLACFITGAMAGPSSDYLLNVVKYNTNTGEVIAAQTTMTFVDKVGYEAGETKRVYAEYGGRPCAEALAGMRGKNPYNIMFCGPLRYLP